MSDAIPTLSAEPHDEGRWRVWCDHCAIWHRHGAGAGPRVAHCRVEGSPYSANGYALELDVEGSQRRVAAYAIPVPSDFTLWQLTQTNREGWRGLVAQDIADDVNWPQVDDLAAIEDYLSRVGAHDEWWHALREAWAEFAAR